LREERKGLRALKELFVLFLGFFLKSFFFLGFAKRGGEGREKEREGEREREREKKKEKQKKRKCM
jgi:hypothetical protein